MSVSVRGSSLGESLPCRPRLAGDLRRLRTGGRLRQVAHVLRTAVPDPRGLSGSSHLGLRRRLLRRLWLRLGPAAANQNVTVCNVVTSGNVPVLTAVPHAVPSL